MTTAASTTTISISHLFSLHAADESDILESVRSTAVIALALLLGSLPYNEAITAAEVG